MTLHVKDEFPVNHDNVETAFEHIFGEGMLRVLYGADVSIGAWTTASDASRTRTIKGKVDVDGAPEEIMRVLGGSKLRASTIQTVRDTSKNSDQSIQVQNKVRMHFLGAELVRVRPQFLIRKSASDRQPVFQADVKLDAFFPPPVNMIVESFMATFARKQIMTVRVSTSSHEGQ